MLKLDHVETLKTLCRATGKFGMYLDFRGNAGSAEIVKAAPYLKISEGVFVNDGDKDDSQMIYDGSGFFLFDSEQEMEATFDRTVGDEGPTEFNDYDGPVRVYALTCGPDGETRNENT